MHKSFFYNGDFCSDGIRKTNFQIIWLFILYVASMKIFMFDINIYVLNVNKYIM